MHCRSQIHNQNSKLQQYKFPGGGHVPQALPASRPPGGCRVPPGAKRLRTHDPSRHRPTVSSPPPDANAHEHHCCCSVRLAEYPSPPGATHSRAICVLAIGWRSQPRRQAPYQ
ncbi:hypothetical protein DEO72_LG2g2960 [Vigna unguiculata]|uniref:Uncharacterized protein n=1 Tax=Vigna unguiculata TaxID=3917 RepID=A0A4D6L2B9_VIGUN|nr:hypothetical protein DEO72_LG2g2960 [Vigna unguiculata]